jgi:hypothetical protein
MHRDIILQLHCIERMRGELGQERVMRIATTTTHNGEKTTDKASNKAKSGDRQRNEEQAMAGFLLT